MPVSAMIVPIVRPKTVRPSEGCTVSKSSEPANVGSRNDSRTWSTNGIWMKPPMIARTARPVIATFIEGSRSAMWWSGPGKPTSVSSTSPVAGFVCTSAWWRWPSSSSRASGTGSPQNARKIIRNV